MGRNSRERHKSKRKAADAARRRRGATDSGLDDATSRMGAWSTPWHRQIAEQLIEQAISALHFQQAGEFEHVLDLLDAGPGGAVGVQVVNRALFAALLGEVERAWRRGWQPSELVRAAHREHTMRHARLVADACAARMRDYPAATIGHAWKMQMAAIEACVWWTHDDLFVNDWAERQGVDRATSIATTIEVLHLLLAMPPVEPVCPMPGAVGSADIGAVGRDLDQRLLDRVRALLAKAEATDFPEEAEAYTAKAQELMTRHRIDHALLAATAGDRDRPAVRRIAVDNPYEVPKTLLLQVVAEANTCRAVWMKRFGLVAVVGFAADLEATEVLFTSLLVQATRTMTASGSKADTSGRNTTRSFRQSFLASYASRIGERLCAVSDQVGREAGASERGAALLPVLAARSDAVNGAFAEQFPDLTQISTHVNNREGWASRRVAADRAALHGRDELAGERHGLRD